LNEFEFIGIKVIIEPYQQTASWPGSGAP